MTTIEYKGKTYTKGFVVQAWRASAYIREGQVLSWHRTLAGAMKAKSRYMSDERPNLTVVTLG